MTMEVGSEAFIAAVDHALTTTRAVRKRLDLSRDVSNELLLECIDIAEQAPTGGNLGSRRWIIIRDQAIKDRMAELYLEAGASWVIDRAAALEGTDHPNAKMMGGAAHLAKNIANVPVLVIPTIVGTHDGSGNPGLFDSVIQSGWSFHVALRARGLGSTWTTMYMGKKSEVAELLGIPEGVTQIALFPVAHTVGTEFKKTSRRHPARDITFFDHYGRTVAAQDPGVDRTFADGAGAMVEVDIKAKPHEVWALATDLDLPGRFSQEFVRGEWDDPDGEPGVGSTFTGFNVHDKIGEWSTTSHVVEWDPPNRFGWNVSDPESPGAQWRFSIELIPGGTRLMYHLTLGPGSSGLTPALEAMPDKEAKILARRQDEHRANMQRVVDGIKAVAEGGAATGGADSAETER